MIKKFLLGLLVGFVGFLGFSSSEWIIHQNGQYFVSQLDNTMQLNVNNKGQLMSQRFGFTSRMLAFASSENNRIYFMWGQNQKPYFFITTRDVQSQGYLKTFMICSGSGPEFTGGFSDCVSYNINDSFSTIVGGLFDSMTINDYWGFNINTWNCYPYGNVVTNQIAFSSSEFNRTILFGVGFGNTEHCVVNQPNNLTGSVGFSQDTDYSAIPTSFLSNPPGFQGGGEVPAVPSEYQCPTVRQLINNYNENGFYSGMCYTSDRIFNGSTFETIEPQSILDLYSSSESFVNDLYKFGQYCESSVYNQSVCAEAFSGQVYKFNLISKLPTNLTYMGGRKQTYVYCNLYTLDPNSTTCTLGTGTLGSLGTEYTNSDVVHSLANSEYNIVLPATTGTVYDGNYTYSGDVISNIQNLFTKFTSLFKKQTGNNNGFLPTWIIYPFLILVLFKLFKK